MYMYIGSKCNTWPRSIELLTADRCLPLGSYPPEQVARLVTRAHEHVDRALDWEISYTGNCTDFDLPSDLRPW
jgi:hypothetical protein